MTTKNIVIVGCIIAALALVGVGGFQKYQSHQEQLRYEQEKTSLYNRVLECERDVTNQAKQSYVKQQDDGKYRLTERVYIGSLLSHFCTPLRDEYEHTYEGAPAKLDTASVYEKALRAAGGASGEMASSLLFYEDELIRSGATQRQAMEALTGLVRTGIGFGAGKLEHYAHAAVQGEIKSGIPIYKSVANFQHIEKYPKNGSIAVSDEMNYMTVSIFQQIINLEESYNHSEAAALAMDAYADALLR